MTLLNHHLPTCAATRFLSSGYVLVPSMYRSAISAVIILFRAATFDSILNVLVVSCHVFCHTEFPIDDESLQVSDGLRSPRRDDAGHGSCSANSWIFWSVPSVQLQTTLGGQLPGNACSPRRTRVPTSPVVVVIKDDANALLSADMFQ